METIHFCFFGNTVISILITAARGEMEMIMKKLPMLLVLLILLSACTHQDGPIYAPSTDTNASAEETKTQYSDFDLVDTWNADTATTIVFSGGTAQIDGTGAVLIEKTLQINQEGTYVFQGEFSGSVQVSLAKTQKAQLVLNGITIRSEDTAAIYISSADKVVVTLAAGTKNTLNDGTDYVRESGAEPNACLFSKDDLTINGTGSLTVFGNSNNGIGTKNDLKIVGGNLSISASKNALKGNDSVRILNGNITAIICADGIKSDNETESDKGFVSISGGILNLNCTDDGIQAVTGVTISKGASVSVHADDKSVNCDGTIHIDEGCLTEK